MTWVAGATLSTLVNLSILLGISLAQNSDVVVVRPFSDHDSDKLIKSFERWDEFPPCIVPDHTTAPAELILYYSKSRDTLPSSINEFVHDLGSVYWRNCFRSVRVLIGNLSDVDDVYNPTSQYLSSDWNRGPNQQFLAINKWLVEQGPKDGVFYYMEPDSIPIVPDWLTRLGENVEEQARFIVFGGRYVGHNWDSMRDSLPPTLLAHINGNAVYNYSDPFYQEILTTLDKESHCEQDCKARSSFDVRICEILMNDYGATVEQLPLRNGAGYRHTKKLANFAGTVVLPQDVDASQTIIVHGAKYFLNWPHPHMEESVPHWYPVTQKLNEDAHSSLELIITDWGVKGELEMFFQHLLQFGTNAMVTTLTSTSTTTTSTTITTTSTGTTANRMLDGVARSFHQDLPFNAVSVVTSSASHASTVSSNDWGQHVTTRTGKHGASEWDLCEAPVTSTWFMIVDSRHSIGDHFHLPVDVTSKGDVKPLAPYTNYDSFYCRAECKSRIEAARAFKSDFKFDFQISNSVFHREHRDKYCSMLIDELGAAILPSVDGYFAFVLATREGKDLYSWYDQERLGVVKAFIPPRPGTNSRPNERPDAAPGEQPLQQPAVQVARRQDGCFNSQGSFLCTPTVAPTQSVPTSSPSARPSAFPTVEPSSTPTLLPTVSTPTASPTVTPTSLPTSPPTVTPTLFPTSSAPTTNPTTSPTTSTPTSSPTTSAPTQSPSFSPTLSPTLPRGQISLSSSSVVHLGDLTSEEKITYENGILGILGVASRRTRRAVELTRDQIQSIALCEVCIDIDCGVCSDNSTIVIESDIVMDDQGLDALFFEEVVAIVAELNATDYSFEFSVNGTNVTIGINGTTLAAEKKPYTFSPTISPTTSSPTTSPTNSPTNSPTTNSPTVTPSVSPTYSPTTVPSHLPTGSPTTSPSNFPTSASPSLSPSSLPTQSSPTTSPSLGPTIPQPTTAPTTPYPTSVPTTASPTSPPTTPTPTYSAPTLSPTMSTTTLAPSQSPSHAPTVPVATIEPSDIPEADGSTKKRLSNDEIISISVVFALLLLIVGAIIIRRQTKRTAAKGVRASPDNVRVDIRPISPARSPDIVVHVDDEDSEETPIKDLPQRSGQENMHLVFDLANDNVDDAVEDLDDTSPSKTRTVFAHTITPEHDDDDDRRSIDDHSEYDSEETPYDVADEVVDIIEADFVTLPPALQSRGSVDSLIDEEVLQGHYRPSTRRRTGSTGSESFTWKPVLSRSRRGDNYSST
eukprot:m.186918 g.186918  ORF g.186918 m.186918 type:complete len:1250 (-) comp32286_c0_seq2:151-3900(-)